MLNFLEQFSNVVVAVFGIAAFGWGFVRWRGRPRFICGVPPLEDERRAKKIPLERIGTQSVARGFRHSPDCFAGRFRNFDPVSRKRLLADKNRCRTVQVVDRQLRLPVVLANAGGRVAENYRASILLHSEDRFVHLVDVATETLSVGIYAHDSSRLSDRLKGKAVAPEILAAYADYMSENTAGGDLIFLRGNLEAGMHELVHVVAELDSDPPCDEFFLLFTLHCSDGWLGSKTFIQACRVKPQTDPGVVQA